MRTISDGVLINGSWNWTLKVANYQLELPLSFEAHRW